MGNVLESIAGRLFGRVRLRFCRVKRHGIVCSLTIPPPCARDTPFCETVVYPDTGCLLFLPFIFLLSTAVTPWMNWVWNAIAVVACYWRTWTWLRNYSVTTRKPPKKPRPSKSGGVDVWYLCAVAFVLATGVRRDPNRRGWFGRRTKSKFYLPSAELVFWNIFCLD